MTRYTAAIVGCGSIGNAHMEGYNLLDEVEVVAVCDPSMPARKTYMDEYGIDQLWDTVYVSTAEVATIQEPMRFQRLQ